MVLNLGGLVVCRPALFSRGVPSQGIFLMSDLHIGAPNIDYDLINRELAAAKDRNDRIALNGDVFDMILTKDAKRFTPGCVAERLAGCDDIVNKALDWAEELLSPYADHLDMIGCGNQETSTERHGSIDTIGLLIHRLKSRAKAGHVIHHGGYGGFLRYGWEKKTFTIFYWHGAGGGSSSTALGELSSRGGFVEGADLSWYAHRHIRVVSQAEKVCCPVKGDVPFTRRQWLVRTGSYFQPYGGQSQEHIKKRGRRGNYAADALLSPQGRGGVRVVLSLGGSSKIELSEGA